MKNASNWLKNAIFKIRTHDLEIAKNETAILEILLQIETKKEYADLGFDGLFSFCIKTFGWSETQTSNRTQAMYAMRAVPEIKEKIDSGTMSVTTVAQVQRYLRQEQTEAGVKHSASEKLKIFESFEQKTSLQVKEEIAQRRGERIKFKLSLELDEEAEELWNQVRNLSAHQTQGSTLNCLKVLMKSFIAQKKKAKEAKNGPKESEESATQSRRTTSLLIKVRPRPMPSDRGISAETRRAIFERDRQQCRNCGSAHALQIDHVLPIAKGGTSDLANLRLLCRSCNLKQGIQQFGPAKMRRIGETTDKKNH